MITMNVLDKDLIKNKILTTQELKEYSELRIGSTDGHEKWLFLHETQAKILKAVQEGRVDLIKDTISSPQQAPAIRGAR